MTIFVTRAVSPVNCIIGEIIKNIKKKLKRIIKARNISSEVSLPFFRTCFVVYPFNAVLANFFVTGVVLPGSSLMPIFYTLHCLYFSPSFTIQFASFVGPK